MTLEPTSPLDRLTADLSPHARHAAETYSIAFNHGDPEMTVCEMRAMIRRLYGVVVDEELERYLKARVDAVIPK